MNISDSERIAGILEKAGWIASSEIEADFLIINACSVRQSAVDRVYGIIKKTKGQMSNTKYVLTGCLLPEDEKKLKDRVDLIFNIKNLPKLPKMLINFYNHSKDKSGSNKLSNSRPKFSCFNTSHQSKNYLTIIPKYQSPFSAYIPISTGCNNFCSYCVVPYTRGREIYRPVEEIIAEVKMLVEKGYKDIILLGQNVNSYQNSKLNFPQLLQILNDIAGDFQISFLTSHPKDVSDELIKTIAKCDKIKKEFHLPVQSGDDEILKKMNRGYTVKEYENLISKIRKISAKSKIKINDIKFSTDIIVGFPGETKKQFTNTVKLIRKIKFDKAYIAQYSPRRGTIADQLKNNVPKEEKKRRWKILDEMINAKKKRPKR